MFLKIKLLEIFNKSRLRYFNTTSMSGRASKLVQFLSGGDDFCPSLRHEGLADCIGSNPADGVVFAWRDDVVKTAQEGEKRIYAVKIDPETKEPIYDDVGNMTVAAEIHLKNDGSIAITGGADLNIKSEGDVNIKSTNATIEAETVNLGGAGGALVLTENSTIIDGNGKTCTITSNTTKTKAV